VRNDTESLFEHGISLLGWMALGIFASGGVAMGLVALGLATRAPWEPLGATICIAAVVLSGMTILTGLSIGFFFLPAAACGLAALFVVLANSSKRW
jgi:hypothetical protein